MIMQVSKFLESCFSVLYARKQNGHIIYTSHQQIEAWSSATTFLKGTCKFGTSCRFEHPKGGLQGMLGNISIPIKLNVLDLYQASRGFNVEVRSSSLMSLLTLVS